MTLRERFKDFLVTKNLNPAAADKRFSFSNGLTGKFLKGETNFGIDKIEKILSEYPELNADWLFTGRGNMEIAAGLVLPEVKSQPIQRSYSQTPRHFATRSIPIFDAKAAAGNPYIFDEPDYFRKLESFTFPASMFRNGDYGILQVRGDSMESTMYAGDYVVGRYVESLNEVIPGSIYIVIYQEDSRPFFTVKRCYYYLGDDNIHIRADNPLYQPRDSYISVASILKLYQVVGRFTMNIDSQGGNLIEKVERLDNRVGRIEEGQ